ncbi:MAG: Glutathione hydrolase proenzyme [Chlamydiales bacterium]|nr:Glutathione hydrolase proenzyme [Chlamydiales bacterium]MCH9619466.1 Glutathione hydrolase proenzyme [Chlamydiales bacterium]MCH9622270.1 Glutathione hydrolase proenzyme [Chlamydiales bacterium]
MICFLLTLLLTLPPEAYTGHKEKEVVCGDEMMVVTANPHASEAAFSILEEGGNAMDATIAAQLVLGLVEPQSSGLGGGAFLLYYNKERGKVIAFDGREIAPENITDLLAGQQCPIVGGKSVGVPGLIAMLKQAHDKEGKLPWDTLFDHAIALAERGFVVSPRLQKLIQTTPNLDTFEETHAYLFDQTFLKNPKLAATYREIANKGIEPFYQGKIGEEIVRTVQNASVNAGMLTMEDLDAYQPVIRRPIKIQYRGYTIYGFPPPSSGGITVFQIMLMLQNKNLKELDLESEEFITLFCNASNLAFADRNYYVGDPAFFSVPTTRLIDRGYMRQRSKLVNQHRATKKVSRGTYPQNHITLHASMAAELPCTSHVCVVDREGNGASLSTSIENAFGSTLMAGGFFLNNQLTDFSPSAGFGGMRVANGIKPHKRPMSAMAPLFVFKEGKLVLVLGSSGGPWIIDFVAQALCGVLDFNLNIQEAISCPHYGAIGQAMDLESNTFLEDKKEVMETRGFTVRSLRMPSGTSGIQVSDGKLIGGADPRREGIVISK